VTVTKLSGVPVGGSNKVSNPTAIYTSRGKKNKQKQTKKPLIKLPDYNCFVIPAGEFLLPLPFRRATSPYIYICFSVSMALFGGKKTFSPTGGERWQ